MRAVPVSFRPNRWPDAAWRRRGTLAIVIAVHVLVLILLFRPGPPQPLPPPPAETKTFDVRQFPDDIVAQKPAPRGKVAKAERTSGGAVPQKPTPPVEPPTPPPPRPVDAPLDMIEMSRDVFAAADIGAMPRRAGPPAPGAGIGSGRGAGSGDDQGGGDDAGEGPGGERLYNAEWYRRPTNAELAFYMPRGARPQSGWGEIACRTIPDYRVDQCQELGGAPAGAGLARVLRQAAWQFRVRPPRIGGKPQIGAWVRIHFDFTVTESDQAGSGR
jgi:protein TonB